MCSHGPDRTRTRRVMEEASGRLSLSHEISENRKIEEERDRDAPIA